MWRVALSLVLLWSPGSSAVPSPVQVSCKNENGVNVDWFTVYKAPYKLNVRTGLEYIYVGSDGKRVMSPSSISYKAISDTNGVLAHTLGPMLRSVRDMPPSFGFLSYSDQPPGANAQVKRFGHAKGVVLGDSSTNTALWLSHSTPQFPFRRSQNFWPESGEDNGQTFLCVSLHFSTLATVGEHLKNIQAYPFDYDLPTDFPNALREAANWVPSDLLQGQFQNMLTRNNKQLQIMAKRNDKSQEVRVGDLYVQLATGFNSDMTAQTWGCQQKRDMSFCDTDMHHVLNAEDISTELGSWTTKQDHSKWAVTTERNIAWTCFGDVNRSGSQYERSGGAVCIYDAQVNTFFKAYVTKKLQCGKRPAPCDDMELEI